MNDYELFEIVKEIIISYQPLAASTSAIRDRLHKYGVYKNNQMLLKSLKQWAERDSNLIGGKIGREYYWRYDKGGVLNGGVE